MAQNSSQEPCKAVIHCDVDCFYRQVEVLDDPALANRPLAVHQGNSGGFVAVNYKVSAQILDIVSQHATNGKCEKTSYDDFYVEVLPDNTALMAAESWLPPPDSEVHVVGSSSFTALPAVLKWAAKVACNIRSAVQQELALSVSFGIAVGKLAARLAGPLHKPSGMTLVPPLQAAALLLDTPILKIPHLRGQLGKQVIDQLSVEYVRDLAAFQAKELIDMFGTATGQLLFDLGHCIDGKRVQARGPQQNICCTKSYHGLREFARVDEALQRLVFALWPRLLEERSKSGRIPSKLKLSCKQGGREQQTRTYALPFPPAVISQLKATALGSIDPALTQSSAVHTLIPNLAPRSRLQQSSARTNSRASSELGPSDAFPTVPAETSLLRLPGADDFSKATGSSPGNAAKLLESGPHQAARQAIFQAAMGLLKPKLAEPVLVNFMAVTGEYAKDTSQAKASNQGAMLRFLHKQAAAPSCLGALSSHQDMQVHAESRVGDQCAASSGPNKLPKKHSMQDSPLRTHPQSGTAMSKHVKLPRMGTGPMDRFLQ